MPALEGIFKKVLGAGSEIGERFSARAGEGAERDAEGKITKPGMNIFDNAAMSYHETMLGNNSSLARKSMGYGVPGVIGAGMGIGAYNEAQNGNTGGAAILGAGAAVMGGALALAHFGGVAEKGVSRAVAESIPKGLQTEEGAASKIGRNDTMHAKSVIDSADRPKPPPIINSPYGTPVTDDVLRREAMQERRAAKDAAAAGVVTDAMNKRSAESIVESQTIHPAQGANLSGIPGMNQERAVSQEDMAGMNSRLASASTLAEQHNATANAAAASSASAKQAAQDKETNKLSNVINRQFPNGVG